VLRQRFGGLKPMQALDKYKARAVGPDEDRRLQTLVENARRDLVYSLLFKARSPLRAAREQATESLRRRP
jgi:hypothetical protein